MTKPAEQQSKTEEASTVAAQSTDPEEYNFPTETKISEMTPDQQTEYWRHKARKWEARANERKDYDDLKTELEQLRTEKLSESEKAIEAARKEGENLASQKMGGKLASAHVWGALRGQGLEDEEIETKLAYLDFNAFLDDNGDVDSDKVNGFLGSVTPKESNQNGTWPDLGGGQRGNLKNKKSSGSVSAGRDLHASLRKTSN